MKAQPSGEFYQPRTIGELRDAYLAVFRRWFSGVAKILGSATVWFFLLVCVGITTILWSIYLLAGFAWWLLATGLVSLINALMLRIGIARG